MGTLPVYLFPMETLTTQAGLSNTRKLAERPSRFLHAIYSAVSWNLPA